MLLQILAELICERAKVDFEARGRKDRCKGLRVAASVLLAQSCETNASDTPCSGDDVIARERVEVGGQSTIVKRLPDFVLKSQELGREDGMTSC